MAAMTLQQFLRPLYQDLDGASRFDQIERIGALARRLAPSSREMELLVLFHGLGSWLEKVGNLSRTLLSVEGLTEEELRRTAASIRRLEEPATDAERAVAAARLIDAAGVLGLAERLARSRREGRSVLDVVREALADTPSPDWLPPEARSLLAERHEARREVCRRILEETSIPPHPAD
jgi:hypothetical protein